MAYYERNKLTVAKSAPKTRVIEIEYNNNKKDGGTKKVRVTIPENAKITYAPVFMGDKNGYGDREAVLRIYEGTQNNQRALFRNVRSFRDTSYAMEEYTEKIEQVDTYVDDGVGSSSRLVARKAEGGWLREEEDD